jgi:DNA-binding Xre family transcriptional regulator
MLCYNKLFEMLKTRGINKSDLRNLGFSPTIPTRLSKGEHINTSKIE